MPFVGPNEHFWRELGGEITTKELELGSAVTVPGTRGVSLARLLFFH